jgi:hypothetical protein
MNKLLGVIIMAHKLSTTELGIVVNKFTFDNFQEWANHKEEEGIICIFADTEREIKDEVYIIAHGTRDGYIAISGLKYNPNLAIETFINTLDHFKIGGIKKIWLVSCYGGLIPKTISNGVEMESIHQSTEKIIVRSFYNTNTEGEQKFALVIDLDPIEYRINTVIG